jgi:hypothetical protein
MKKRLIIIALIAVLACVGLVAADEAGIISINIVNSSNSKVGVNVSNSTIQAQTNFTNSQAWENITLTNSTLTLNVNGQNITISSHSGNIVVSTQNQTVAANPNSPPFLSVSFLASEPTTQNSALAGNGSIEYDFNVTVSVPTSMNFPFGVNATHTELNHALLPLIDKYDLVTMNYPNENGNGTGTTGTIKSALWIDEPIVSGMNNFSLFSYEQLNATQIEAFTNDLFNAFTLAMNGSA